MIEAGGVAQLIIWQPQAVSSLNPATGEVYWEQPFSVYNSVTVATPIQSGNLLMVSAARDGSLMLELDSDRPAARHLWESADKSDAKTTALYCLNSTPLFYKDHIYGVCHRGELRCLDPKTGVRLWETMDATHENQRDVTAFLVRNDDRFFINNDRGDLIIAELSPAGYKEISRTHLIKPTTDRGSVRGREFGAVNWTHPAYANRCIITRNDREILRASLEEPSFQPQHAAPESLRE
jgi:outer membrane protein assembly factor BamB